MRVHNTHHVVTCINDWQCIFGEGYLIVVLVQLTFVC